jgi:hypothetical protein
VTGAEKLSSGLELRSPAKAGVQSIEYAKGRPMGRPFSFVRPEGAALCRLFEREWARRKGNDKLPKQRQKSLSFQT